MKKKVLSSKEKKEIGLILGSVLLVAIVGLLLTQIVDNKSEAIVGEATHLDKPTYSGVITLLNSYCVPINSGGAICNDVCNEKSRI